MRACIGCGKVLTAQTRSMHQPTLRCCACFKKFAAGVKAVFEGQAISARGFAGEAAEAAKEKSK